MDDNLWPLVYVGGYALSKFVLLTWRGLDEERYTYYAGDAPGLIQLLWPILWVYLLALIGAAVFSCLEERYVAFVRRQASRLDWTHVRGRYEVWNYERNCLCRLCRAERDRRAHGGAVPPDDGAPAAGRRAPILPPLRTEPLLFGPYTNEERESIGGTADPNAQPSNQQAPTPTTTTTSGTP